MTNKKLTELPERSTSQTVMVVDDERVVRDVLCMFLERKGYKTVALKDGHSAISMAGKQKPDVIFLDMKMPGLDGIKTCRRLKRVLRSSPGTGIIMITGYDPGMDLESLHASGAIDVISKPFDLKDISGRINIWFEVRDIKSKAIRARKYSEKLDRHLKLGLVR
ncbi:MAG TPA: response regulator [Nitrospirae bacterium]|nr:response regulator [Nitrospirota bacterium]HDK82154.1 response regulator [Nitrospirota bacterium]